MKIEAFAICDTDGNRKPAKPLLRHIYHSRQIAEQHHSYFRYPEYYPVKKVTVEVEDD